MNELPKTIAEELARKASSVGISIEEYLFDLLFRDLDPVASAEKYIMGAQQLLEQAEQELRAGDLRQASEKIWGACALSIKAHALAKKGLRLETHGDLWVYKNEVARKLGDWVRVAFMMADSMRRNSYEDIATGEDIESALREVRNLVNKISETLSLNRSRSS
ncbi:MAG: PaREP1 family protein [Sulfolobales archaeon]